MGNWLIDTCIVDLLWNCYKMCKNLVHVSFISELPYDFGMELNLQFGECLQNHQIKIMPYFIISFSNTLTN